MSSKEALQLRHKTASSNFGYNAGRTGKDASDLVAFMDNSIKKEFESFSLLSICGGERRIRVEPQFEAAFLTLSLEEKLNYYESAVNTLIEQQR
jgi:hypothetical protein